MDTLPDPSLTATPPSLTDTVLDLAASVLRLPGVLAGEVIVFEGERARLVGLATALPVPLVEGQLLPRSRAVYLRGRAASGPWVEAWPDQPLDGAYTQLLAGAGYRAALYVPVEDEGGVIGLLVAVTSERDGERVLAGHVAVGCALAAGARPVLRASIRAADEIAHDRSVVAAWIADGAYTPVYQPIVDLVSREAVGFEAMTRFSDGTPPERACEQAERAGLLLDLEEATLRSAVRGADALPAGRFLCLAVSAALVLDGYRLTGLLAKRHRPIVLEITEREPVDDYPNLRHALRRLGADIAVAADDAGAASANLLHVMELRPNVTKMDVSLVRGIEGDVACQALARSLLAFARATGQWLIADGVATEGELATLLGLGVRFGQGSLFGRPRPAETWAEADRGATAPRAMRLPGLPAMQDVGQLLAVISGR